MSEIVARVAKAIGCIDSYGCPREEGKCEVCLEMARDAIAAMREPTDPILFAGQGYMEQDERFGGYEHAQDAWRDMIDAALADSCATSSDPVRSDPD